MRTRVPRFPAVARFLVVAGLLTALALVGSGAPGLSLAIPAAIAIVLLPGIAFRSLRFRRRKEDLPVDVSLALALGFAYTTFASIGLHLLTIDLTPLSRLVVLLIGALGPPIGVAVWRRWNPNRAGRGPRLVAEVAITEPEDMSMEATVTDGAPGTWRGLIAGGRDRSPRNPVGLHVARRDLVLFGLALVLVAVSFRIAQAGVVNQPTQGFTQFWLLPLDEPSQLMLGIRNAEGNPQTYRVRLLEGTTLVGEWTNIQLDSGATWTISVAVTASEPMQARLFRSTDPGVVYRTVTTSPRG